MGATSSPDDPTAATNRGNRGSAASTPVEGRLVQPAIRDGCRIPAKLEPAAHGREVERLNLLCFGIGCRAARVAEPPAERELPTLLVVDDERDVLSSVS